MVCLKGEKLVAIAVEYEIRKNRRLPSDEDRVYR